MRQGSGAARHDAGAPMAGVRAELAAAVRRVNAAFYAIPEAHRPDPAPYEGLDAEVNAAFAACDRRRALAAIEAWREHSLSRYAQILASAPLEDDPATR